MTNARAKGSQYEREAAKHARSLDYKVYNPPSVKFQRQDIFGFGDLLIADETDVILVQVKGSRKTNHFSMKEMGRLAKRVPDAFIKELWVRERGAKFNRFYWDSEKWVEIDE